VKMTFSKAGQEKVKNRHIWGDGLASRRWLHSWSDCRKVQNLSVVKCQKIGFFAKLGTQRVYLLILTKNLTISVNFVKRMTPFDGKNLETFWGLGGSGLGSGAPQMALESTERTLDQFLELSSSI
jgi:hypothetical protein